MEILDYAFNPIPEGEEDRIQVCYDGSDIPDDNTRRNHGTGDRKRNQAPTGQNNTVRANIGQNSDRTHNTVNFDNREQHRTSTLVDVQQRLTQIAQENSSANMENVCPARSRDKNMMGNLRRTINYMKEGAQNREAARRLPKFVNRTIDKVSEDNIATISITEIQTILNEDINLIFDALVIGDYIEDEEEA